jgi:superfamily II DNA or RNA helicase
VLKTALAAIHATRPAAGLWTAASAAIELWPYQLEPALAAIAGATRLLLADAVGLGKTIQAGLLLAELRERGWVERALIVCPAGLRDSWARELRDRFAIAAAVVDQAALAERVAALPSGVNPWAGHDVTIASIDFIKRPEVLAAIEREPIDLVIADEAHHLAPGTDRGAAVTRLAARAPWCVLVSATPHSGDQSAFDYLTTIGSTGDPLAIFRRGRRDVGLAVSRRTHLLGVLPTPDEMSLLTDVNRYAQAIWQARGLEDPAVRLIAVTLARRAASSRRAIERTLRRRFDLLVSADAGPIQPALPWDDEDRADDVEEDAALGTPGLDNLADERAAIEQLLLLAGRCETSSKIRRLQRILDRAGEPAVVFTEYRDTLDEVAAALSGSKRVGAIHGGVPLELRRAAVEAFNRGDVDVLVATDTAGEGLNLHHRCRLVIDLELPWNPQRLEQRVGRVDRLGQRRTVHAIRLFHPGTIEHRVLGQLHVRQRRADAALEDTALNTVTDRDIATAIFDGREIAEQRAPLVSTTTIANAAMEACRVSQQRRAPQLELIASIRAWAAPRNHRPTPLIVVHRVTLANQARVVVGDAIDLRRVSLARWPQHRREWQAAIDEIAVQVSSTIAAETATLLAAVASDRATCRAHLTRRLEMIRRRLAREQSIEYQRSLFDGRADTEARAGDQTAAALDAALARTLQRATAAIALDGVRVEFVAAWPEKRR